MVEFIQSVGFVVLIAIIQILVCIAAVFLIVILKKLSTKIGLETDDLTMQNIESIVQKFVVAANQQIVDSMKEANPTGKLTDEQAEQVFSTVKTNVLSCLTDKQLTYLSEKYGNADVALKNLIEVSVSYNHSSVISTSAIDDDTVETSEEVSES